MKNGEEDGLREMGREKASLPKPGKQVRGSTHRMTGSCRERRTLQFALGNPKNKGGFLMFKGFQRDGGKLHTR